MLTHVRLLINHMNVDELPEILTLSQACEMLNCHPNTLRNWDKEGILVAIRLGSRRDRRYRKTDVLNMLKAQ
jgi:excisionase family DNA binding protein